MRELLKKASWLNIIEWLLITALLTVTFLIFYYSDYSDTLDNGVMLVESIVKGQFTDYYHYAAVNANDSTVYSANYSIFLYAIFAIWNLPTVILHIWKGFDYMTSVKALLWAKMLILVAVVLSAYVLKKIVELYSDKSAARVSQILFLAGSCVVIPAMVTVQYDILSILVMLCGLYFYLKKRDVLFMLFFALAVPLKMFALFAYVPLLLLREKRIPMIIVKMIPAFAINFICSLPFRGDTWYELCMDTQNHDALDLLINSGFSISGQGFNLFIFLYLAMCVMCYIKKENSNALEEECYRPIYVVFATFSVLTAFINIRSYWVILVVPFAIAVVFFNRKYLMENVLLLTIGTGCYTLHAFINHWVLSYGTQVTILALQKFIQIPEREALKYGTIYEMLEAMDLTKYSSMLRTVFVTSLVLLLVLNFPASKNIKQWIKEDYPLKWWYGILQIGITAVLVAVLLYADLAKAPVAAVNLIGSADGYMEADIISGAELSQTFEVGEDTDISELIILANNTNNYRNLRSVAAFSIVDDDTKELIVEKEVGTALVYTGKRYVVDLGKKAKLLQGHTYTLSITADTAVQKGSEVFNFAKTGTLILEDYPLSIDGKPQDYNLAFTLR